jgi:hypothetical protein
MTITFGDFKLWVITTLGSQEDVTYTDDLIYEGLCLALDAIMPWVPNQNLATLTSGSGTGIALPEDCYQPEAVIDASTGEVLERVVLSSGRKRPVSGEVKTSPYDWLEYPKGYLYFTVVPTDVSSTQIDETTGAPISVSRSFLLFYQAYWSKPASKDDDTFILPMPSMALTGILYWVCAHCVVPGATTSAQIRQFNTKVDSGVPTDNALENMAIFFRRMFIEEMNRLPKYRGHAV